MGFAAWTYERPAYARHWHAGAGEVCKWVLEIHMADDGEHGELGTWRGLGLGTAMLEELGLTNILLQALRNNEGACRLYGRLGLEPLSRRGPTLLYGSQGLRNHLNEIPQLLPESRAAGKRPMTLLQQQREHQERVQAQDKAQRTAQQEAQAAAAAVSDSASLLLAHSLGALAPQHLPDLQHAESALAHEQVSAQIAADAQLARRLQGSDAPAAGDAPVISSVHESIQVGIPACLSYLSPKSRVLYK